MHFFNPAPVMRLVEVVGTVLADDGVQAAAADLARRLGKTPVQVGDRAGFVANALLLPYLNHAVTLLETGFASREDIDAAATAGIGLPMGPLALLDLIGLDTSLSIMEVLREEFGGPRYTPAPLLRRLVAAGRTGRKSGRGLYEYADGRRHAGHHRYPLTMGSTPPPATVTLVGTGADLEGELGAAAAAAGISITPDPAGPATSVIIAAEPDSPVLAAALAAGRPQDTVGLHAGGGRLAELVITRLTSPAAAAAAEALARPAGAVGGARAGPAGLPGRDAAVPAPGRRGPDGAGRLRLGGRRGHGHDAGLRLPGAARWSCWTRPGPATAVAVLSAMHEAYGDPAFAPPPLLAEHAAAGLGFRG